MAKDASSTSKKLGILAGVSLTQKMIKAVEDGYGDTFHAKRDKALDKTGVAAKRQDLDDAGCEVFATIGGLYVNTGVSAVASSTTPFVSMVGGIPTGADQNCKGGVSLETIALNKARRAYLLGLGTPVAVANMYLYRDGAGDVVVGGQPITERNEWTGAGAQVFSATASFDNDLNQAGGIPATAEALVIAASPLFLRNLNMSLLVTAANTWLTHPPAGRTRYVIYPFQIYKEATPPPSPSTATGKSILFGPDLYQALRVLGFFASLAADGTSLDWLPVAAGNPKQL
jgi:hypothetical protein